MAENTQQLINDNVDNIAGNISKAINIQDIINAQSQQDVMQPVVRSAIRTQQVNSIPMQQIIQPHLYQPIMQGYAQQPFVHQTNQLPINNQLPTNSQMIVSNQLPMSNLVEQQIVQQPSVNIELSDCYSLFGFQLSKTTIYLFIAFILCVVAYFVYNRFYPSPTNDKKKKKRVQEVVFQQTNKENNDEEK